MNRSDNIPAENRSLRRRVLLVGVEVLLILIVIGLLVATWMPAIVGPSESRQREGERARQRDAR
jgi:competence protein ComGC